MFLVSLLSVLAFVLTNSLCGDEQAFIQGLWPYFFTDMVQGTPSCAGWRFETWEWSDAWEEAWTEAWPWPLIAWTWLWFSFAVAPVSTWIPDAVVMIFGGWISTQIVTFVVGVGNDIHLSRLTCPTVPRISLLTRVAMVFDLDRGTSSIVLQRSSNDWAERRRTGTSGLRGGGWWLSYPKKITQCSKRWELKSGCKRRHSPFFLSMKLLSLEKKLNWKFAYLILSTVSMLSKTY